MARAAKSKTEPQEPQSAWHVARQVIAGLLFAIMVALMLYGAWLGLLMHFTKTMPVTSIWRFLGCAVLAAAIFTVCVRIEPPRRRRRRGKRVINIEAPTQRQIWQTAPGDFVESIFAAIGMMATPAMLFIGFGFVAARYRDLPDLMIATAVAGGAFALQGAFVSWRGRRMWDPPGQVRAAKPEPKAAADAGTEA
jgi:hypothetical protein